MHYSIFFILINAIEKCQTNLKTLRYMYKNLINPPIVTPSFIHSFKVVLHRPLYVTFSVPPSVAHHASGTVHRAIIIFGAHV